MNEALVNATLRAPTLIEVVVFSHASADDLTFLLDENGGASQPLMNIENRKSDEATIYLLQAASEIVLGNRYEVNIPSLGSFPLNVERATEFDSFDELYVYRGNDLGSTYHRTHTEFALWAPLASSVEVKYLVRGKWIHLAMQRGGNGVYRVSIKGNLDGVLYAYVVTNSGVAKEAVDPYGRLSTLNGSASVVCNPSRADIDLRTDRLTKLECYTDAIIYETSVRDMTSDEASNIVSKGTFKGLYEKNRRTKGGNPAGYDYLKYLGITHLQLLPIMDFATIDEENPASSYNWGYDPAQYFVPEGSYASDRSDPYSRLVDLKKMISSFHEDGMRINMDVVFNHVYRHSSSTFEKIVPNYFFRRDSKGAISNHSSCDNDMASERPMVRKLIVDACLYYVREFGVDGFRFDLMGLIDIATIEAIRDEIIKIRPDFMFYGEGWEMGHGADEKLRFASLAHVRELPDIAFFNDWFRDTARGSTYHDNMSPRGYLLDASEHREGFKYVFAGSVIDMCLPSRFLSPRQSINYVECHDNGTLFDKLEVALGEETIEQRLERIKLINSAVMTSLGVPFFHMGQECGLSKNGQQNTYNIGDELNRMDYRLVDERMSMVEHFRELVKLRKGLNLLRLDDVDAIERLISFRDLGSDGVMVSFADVSEIAPFRRCQIFFNPSRETIYHDFDDYYQFYFASSGNVEKAMMFAKHLMIKPLSMVILVLK